MVLVESLQSFAEQAEALYAANPLKTKYIIKYNHSKGRLTLKVSDDVTTLQYKTDQQSDLKRGISNMRDSSNFSIDHRWPAIIPLNNEIGLMAKGKVNGHVDALIRLEGRCLHLSPVHVPICKSYKIERLNGRLVQWMATGTQPIEETVSEPSAPAASQPRQKKPVQTQPHEASRSKKARRRA